jgi:hypothetical protein
MAAIRYNFDTGLSAEELIRAIAYNRIEPLLAFRQPWSTPKVHELWAKLATFPAVCVRDMPNRKSASIAATATRKLLNNRELYEVRVEHETQVVVYLRTHLSQLPAPPPWWHQHWDPMVWMDIDDVAYMLGVSRDRTRQLVREFKIEHKVINTRGARLFKRADVDRLLQRHRGRYAIPKRRNYRRRTRPIEARYQAALPAPPIALPGSRPS